MLKTAVLRKIGMISRIVASKSDIKFKKYDLQKGQHIFLVRVCEHPGCNLMELTNMLHVDKSTTTKAIQKLEKIGYVTKEHPDNNMKVLHLFPTDKARFVYKQIIKEENIRAELCFKGFTEEERKHAVDYLERMCQNIETYK